MTPAPDVSVVVPTHGRPDQLRRCLDSLLTQTLPRGSSFEVLVVDDGSVPPLVLSDVGDHVTLLRQRQSGPAAARNAGVQAARGALVAFIDDDCEASSGWLAALLGARRRAPRCGYGGRVVNRLSDNPLSETSQLMMSYLRDYYRVDSSAGRFFTSNNLAFDRAALLAHGGFDVRHTRAAGEDRELCDRWVDAGGRIVFVDDAIVMHAHALTFVGFFRQHFNYGRGALGYRRARAARGGRAVRVEPWTFYRDLVWYPVRLHGVRKLPLAGLVVVAQVANVLGFVAELVQSLRA